MKMKKNGNRWQAEFLFGEFRISVIAGDGCYSEPREELDDPSEYERLEVAIMKDGDFVDSLGIEEIDDHLGYQMVPEPFAYRPREWVNKLIMLMRKHFGEGEPE